MIDQKMRILLADDEINIRSLGEKMLQDSGYDVLLASNGAEAIEKAIAERPDLIITDIRMPIKSGFDVCKAVRSDPVINQTPIIILSALGDEYNKLTGFEGGANDFITKPFRTEELNERINLLLARRVRRPAAESGAQRRPPAAESHRIVEIPSGSKALDKLLGGGIPKGSNLLLIGALGRGKSAFAKHFIAEGLGRNERCLFIAVDDDPSQIRDGLNKILPQRTDHYESAGTLRFVDAYSWSSQGGGKDKFKIEGVLGLDQLSDLILKAGSEIDQSVQKKAGGRRVIDSISSFFVNFELPAVQKFISQVAGTAVSFGSVTTLFTVEEGAVNDLVLNNIKYLMDGIIEFKEENGKKMLRVERMKWIDFLKEWVEI